jgi:hypothetical protein
MTCTIETIQTPSEDECGIVATFSEQSLDQLTAIQAKLSERLGDSIWLTPRRALHSTLMEIICDREYSVPRQVLFADWYKQYSRSVSEILAELPAFEITLNEIEVSARAITVRSKNSNLFNTIRSKILSRTVLPDGTKMPPNITHCTLARFNRSVDLEMVIREIQHMQCDFTEHIVGFKLLKDLGPPTFEPKIIQEYSLHL